MTVANFSSMKLPAEFPTIDSFGENALTFVDALKASGVLGVVLGLIFLCFKFKVIRLVAVDSGSEWIRALWGVEQHYKRGKRSGRLVRLTAGRHLLIRGLYDGWEVCIRQIPLVKESLTQPFRRRTLCFDRVTVNYEVISDDTPDGDTCMLRSFLAVRNVDRDNQQSESLDNMVLAIVLGSHGLGKLLKQAALDECGLPVLSERTLMKLTRKRLRKMYGVRLVSVDWTEPYLTEGTQQLSGLQMIAYGLGYTPTTPVDRHIQEGADVVELPTHTQSA